MCLYVQYVPIYFYFSKQTRTVFFKVCERERVTGREEDIYTKK